MQFVWDIRFDSWQRLFFPRLHVHTGSSFHLESFSNGGIKNEWSTQHTETSCVGHGKKCFVPAENGTNIVKATVSNTAYLCRNGKTRFQNFKNVWRSVYSGTTAETVFILKLYFSCSITRPRKLCHCSAQTCCGAGQIPIHSMLGLC